LKLITFTPRMLTGRVCFDQWLRIRYRLLCAHLFHSRVTFWRPNVAYEVLPEIHLTVLYDAFSEMCNDSKTKDIFIFGHMYLKFGIEWTVYENGCRVYNSRNSCTT